MLPQLWFSRIFEYGEGSESIYETRIRQTCCRTVGMPLTQGHIFTIAPISP